MTYRDQESDDDEKQEMNYYAHQNYVPSTLAPLTSQSEVRRRHRMMVLVIVSIVAIIVVISAYAVWVAVPKIKANRRNRPRKQDCSYSAIMLGTNGGLTEENLSATLLSRNNSNAFIALDAGNVMFGLRKFVTRYDMLTAKSLKVNSRISFPFPSWTRDNEIKRAAFIMRNHIWSYFLGHPHLDHISGFVLNTPEDYFTDTAQMINNSTNRPKFIVGLDSTVDGLKKNVFNDQIWPDIPKYSPNRFRYYTVEHGQTYAVNDILGLNPNIRHPQLFDIWDGVTVKSYVTCHERLNSTAYLFSSEDEEQVLYFSDTGVNSFATCDWEGRLKAIWADPALNPELLKAIFIEISFTNDVPPTQLFGHLRPIDLVKSLQWMKNQRGLDSLRNTNVVIQHVKPVYGAGDDILPKIKKEIEVAAADLDVDAQFLYPTQGEYLCFK